MRREWSDEGGADFFKASGASKGVGRKLFRAAKLLRSILYVVFYGFYSNPPNLRPLVMFLGF